MPSADVVQPLTKTFEVFESSFIWKIPDYKIINSYNKEFELPLKCGIKTMIAEMSLRKYKTRDNQAYNFGRPSIKFTADSQIGKKEFSFVIQNMKSGKLSVHQYNPLELNKDYPGSEDYFVSHSGAAESCQDGELCLLVQVSIKDTAAKNPESSLSKAMANLFNSKEFADFTFLINGKPVQAHKYVLAARSPFFYRAFTSDQPPEDFNVFNGISNEVFDDFLNFMYTNKRLNVTKKNVKDFLEIGSRYGIEKLIQTCKCEWQAKLTKENAGDVLNLALRPKPSQQFKNQVPEIISKAAVEVSTQTEEHVQLNEVAAADGRLELPETVDAEKTEDNIDLPGDVNQTAEEIDAQNGDENVELPFVADEIVNDSVPVEVSSMSQEGQENKAEKLDPIEAEGSSEVTETKDEEQVELKTTEENAQLANDVEKSAESYEDDPEDEPKPGVEKDHSLDIPATVVSSEDDQVKSSQVQKEEFAYQKDDENVEFPSVVDETVKVSAPIETSTELLTAQTQHVQGVKIEDLDHFAAAEKNVVDVEVDAELDMPEGDRQSAKDAAPDCDSSAEPNVVDVDTEPKPVPELISSSEISTAKQAEETGEAVLQDKLDKDDGKVESIIATNEKSPEELIVEVSGNSEVTPDNSKQTGEDDPANVATEKASTLAADSTDQADETAKSFEEVTAKAGPIGKPPKGKGKRNKRKY